MKFHVYRFASLILLLSLLFSVSENSISAREKETNLHFPAYYIQDNETVITDEKSINKGKALVVKKFNKLVQNKSWSYEVKNLEFTKSDYYEIIVRSETAWNIEGDTINAIDVLFIDKNGIEGGASKILDN